MKNVLSYFVLGLIVLSFFYYGYKDDYKRNPKEFKKSIFGVIVLMFTLIFGIFGLSRFIERWFETDEKTKMKKDEKA